jgi:F-type H+-transporting ATPase subunit b
MEEITKVFGIDWRLFIIQAINFGLVVFLLSKFLYKPILNVIEERRNIITKGLDDAKLAEQNLQNSIEQKDKLVSEAKEQSQDILSRTKTDAIKMKEKILSDAELEKARLIKEANLRAEEIGKMAVEESKEAVAKMAILAAEKILREGKAI